MPIFRAHRGQLESKIEKGFSPANDVDQFPCGAKMVSRLLMAVPVDAGSAAVFGRGAPPTPLASKFVSAQLRFCVSLKLSRVLCTWVFGFSCPLHARCPPSLPHQNNNVAWGIHGWHPSTTTCSNHGAPRLQKGHGHGGAAHT